MAGSDGLMRAITAISYFYIMHKWISCAVSEISDTLNASYQLMQRMVSMHDQQLSGYRHVIATNQFTSFVLKENAVEV